MNKSVFPFKYNIHKGSPTPIYLQLVTAILAAIREGSLKNGGILPSINFLSAHYGISRSTTEKAYNELKDMGVLGSHHGRGHFVMAEQGEQPRRILFLFNAFDGYHKAIFDSFSQMLSPDTAIEMEVYNNDPVCFERLMHEKTGDYSHYLIIPRFYGDSTEACRIINSLPKNKVILLYDQPDALPRAVG